jgi:hypothetical protein
MDLAAIAVGIQQSSAQQTMMLTMLKQNAQEEQALVQMIASVAGGRGQALDISV